MKGHTTMDDGDVADLVRRLRDVDEPSVDELRALARDTRRLGGPPASRRRAPLTVRWAAALVAMALVAGSGLGFGVGSALTNQGRTLSDFGAFVRSGDAVAAPAAVSTRVCRPAGSSVNLHLLGSKDASFWARPYTHRELFAAVPAQRSFFAAWTFGTQATTGPSMYGLITAGRDRFGSRCQPRTVRAPSRRALGPPIRIKDGWAVGGLFECTFRGQLVVQSERLGSRVRMTVWMERSGEVLGVAEIRRASAWARFASRCVERQQ